MTRSDVIPAGEGEGALHPVGVGPEGHLGFHVRRTMHVTVCQFESNGCCANPCTSTAIHLYSGGKETMAACKAVASGAS